MKSIKKAQNGAKSDSLMKESQRKKSFAGKQEKIGSALVKKGMGDKPMGILYIDGELKSIPTGKQRLEIAKKARESAKKDSIASVKARVKKQKTGGVTKAKDGKWIQKATASIKRRGTKGVCTGSKFGGPTCKPGSKRYALAKTFKSIAKKKK